MVRIDPLRNGELLAMPGSEQAEMGAGRTMGPGWISVGHDAIDTDQQLAFWLDVAMDFNTVT